LIRAARTSALFTHYDARCEWTTVALAVALAVTLSGAPLPPRDLAAALKEVGGSDWGAKALDEVAEAVLEVEGKSLDKLALDDPIDMGYTIKAMQVGLWCLEQEPVFETVVREVVEAGGDTDSNGAVAGAVMGARGGRSSIPQRWIDSVADAQMLLELADRLHQASR
jgi:ADP-ribosylglycohydrolase